ncbi:CTU1 protein, partial [Syrrhaptes paradoxus]|nr:CTU1 protein [Syrrhaptes paradoxus]
GDVVAVAVSGGKDSTVLAHLLRGGEHGDPPSQFKLVLLGIDEGIEGYREAALAAVRRSRRDLPLLLVSHRELFGWSVDEVGGLLGGDGGQLGGAGGKLGGVGGSQGGSRGSSRCTVCGVWRRQALERAARALGVDWIATGHNADDIAETVLMNFLRGDPNRDPVAPGRVRQPPVATPWPAVARWKPLRHAYEKEIVLYAHFRRLDYVSTECVYAPHAYRGHARALLKDLEATRPSSVAALGHSGRRLAISAEVATKTLGACRRCGFAASQELCKACVLVASLERGLPRVGLGKRGLE